MLYPNIPGVSLPTGYYDICENDIKYEPICNPCARKQKVVKIPTFNSAKASLWLAYDEIVRLGMPFHDINNNYYEFVSVLKHNLEFDNMYGRGYPKGYDHSDVYRYYDS